MSEKLQMRSVTSLLNEEFYIPSFQRGYRWNNVQVKNLLDDIWKFRLESESKIKDVFYCLQPIVVSQIDNKWSVIDGQQRLTTIYLILYYLKEGLSFFGKSNFRIHYKTRPESESFLKDIDFSKKDETIDHYHFCSALEAIDAWFKGKDGNARINFLTTLLNDEELGKNVKFIWYNVSNEAKDDKQLIDIFTRLNIGKIPLTNAELCKALFMNSINGDSEASSLKQIQIATEWDKIEQTLQQPQFWNFISNKPNKYDTRIEYIFDLKQGKSSEDENYFTFYKFSDELKQKDVEKVWLDVKKYFMKFEDWYADDELYNLVGYLVNTGEKIEALLTDAESKTKTSFKNDLAAKAKKQFDNIVIDDLDFNEDKGTIRRMLLLFNVLSINQNKKSTSRFPFHHYKSQNWDIEHVHSQTSKEITGKDKTEWAKVLLEYFTGVAVESQNTEELQQQIEKMQETENSEKGFCTQLLKISNNENIDDFIQLVKKLEEYFKEDKKFDDTNGIGNLVLLDESTNRMYQNAFFPVKRKYIIRQERNGIFIPVCTKNVFLKAYSKKINEIMYWNNSDAEDYLEEIRNTLKL